MVWNESDLNESSSIRKFVTNLVDNEKHLLAMLKKTDCMMNPWFMETVIYKEWAREERKYHPNMEQMIVIEQILLLSMQEEKAKKVDVYPIFNMNSRHKE